MANENQTIFQILVDVLGKDAVDKLTESVGGAGEAGTKAAPELQAFVDRLQDLADKSKLVSDAINLQDRLQQNSESLNDAKKSLSDLNAEFDRTDKSSVEITTAFAQAQKQVSSLAAEQVKLQNQSAAMSDKLKLAGINSNELGAAQADLRGKTQTLGQEMLKAADSASAHASRLDTIKEAATKTAESLKSAGETALDFGKKLLEISGIAGVVTSALAAISGFRFFEKGVEEARSGEVALAKLKAAVDGNAESFNHLKEVAEQAAESVGTTSNVAVETLTKLTAQLGSADAAAKALPATLTLAKAASIDFNESAELVATTLKAFGLEADHAGEIADKLAAIASRTGTNLAELARNAAQIAPLAKEAGIGFDGVAAALAELSSKGFDAQKSNAGLRELFIALQDPTNKFRQAIVDAGGDTSNFGSILNALHNSSDRGSQALEGLSAKGRAAVAALVQGGSADLRQFQQVLDQSAGAASKTAKLLGDTFDGAVTAFGRAIDNLAEDAVKGSLPAVKDEIKKLGDELKEVGKTEAFEKIKASIRDFVAGSVKAFDEFIHAINWEELGKTITEFARSAAESMKGFKDSVIGSAGAVKNFATDISTSFNVAQIALDSVGLAIKSTMYYIFAGLEKAAEGLSFFRADAAAAAAKYREIKEQYAKDYKELSEEIDRDSEKVTAALKAQEGQTKATGDAAKEAAEEHEKHAKSLEQTGVAAAKIPTDLDNAISALAHLNSVGTTTGVAVDALRNLIAQLRGETQKLPSALDQTKESLNNAVTALGVLEQAGITTGPAVEALTAQIQSLSAQLRGTGSQVDIAKDQLIGLKNSVSAGSPEFKTLEGAASRLGIVLQGDLHAAIDKATNDFNEIKKASDNSVAGQMNVANAFVAMATEQVRAAAQMDDATKRQVAANLSAMESSANLTAEQKAQVDALIASINTHVQLAKAVGGTSEAMREAEQQAEKYDAAMKTLRDTSAALEDKLKAVSSAMTNASNDTERQAAAAESADLRMQGAGQSAKFLAEAMEGARSEFSKVSDAAAGAFDTAFQGALKMEGIMPQATAAVGKTTNALEQLRQAAQDDIIGMDKWLYALAEAQAATQKKLDAQRESIALQTAELDQLAASGQKNFGILGDSAETVLLKLQQQRDTLQNSNGEFNLLGRQELAPLQQALDGAIQRTQALRDAAKAAEDQYNSLAQSVHDALLQEQGDQAALEDERHKKQLADLENAAKTADELNSASYQKAVQEENQLHDLKMANLQKQAQAAANASKSSGGSSTSAGSGSSNGSSSTGASAATASGAAVHFGTGAIQIQLAGPSKPFASMTHQDQQEFAQQLMAVMMPEMMQQIVYQFQLAKQRS